MMLVGWGTGTGEASSPLRSLLATVQTEGHGPANRGRYSNPKVDELLEQAPQTRRRRQARALLQRGDEIAIEDQA